MARRVSNRRARRALTGGACVALLSFAGRADAEGFHYVDREGYVHEIDVSDKPAPPWPASMATRPAEPTYPYAEAVREAAQLYALPVELILAVMTIESGFNPSAVSPRGAMGLMQLMPATAAEMHVTDAFAPRENTLGGARYLRILVNGAGGDVTVALGAYHAGAGATQRHGGVPPFPDTHRYVASVIRFYRLYQERGPSYAAVIAASLRGNKKDAPSAPHPEPIAPAPQPSPGPSHDGGASGSKPRTPEPPRPRRVDSPDKAVVNAEGPRARSRHGKERARPRRPMKRRRGE